MYYFVGCITDLTIQRYFSRAVFPQSLIDVVFIAPQIRGDQLRNIKRWASLIHKISTLHSMPFLPRFYY